MKHWGKKLAALVLCAAMVIGLVPGMMPAARAVDNELWVGNVQVTSGIPA